MIETVSSESEILLYFGKSHKYTFPLILIIGREYNGEGEVADKISYYDFKFSPRSAFWNRAYTFVGRACGEKIKHFCIKAAVSPIIFGNALPISVPNSIKNKNKLRLQISDNKIAAHIEDMFNQNIVQRVKVAILSGIENESIFRKARSLIVEKCQMHNITCFDVPYFASRISNKKIDRCVSDKNREKIKKLTQQAFDSFEIKNL